MSVIKKTVDDFPSGVILPVKDLTGAIDPCDKDEYEEKVGAENVLYEEQHADSMKLSDVFPGYEP